MGHASLRRKSAIPLFVAVAVATSWAAPPSLIRYDGRLTDDAGVPLDGSYNVDFAIFNAATGGTAVWSEDRPPMAVENGVIEVMLGETTPLAPSVFSGPERWLEITVDGTALIPRQRLASVPYAHASQSSTDLDGFTAGNAAGQIPVSNGALNENLNADLLDGMQASEIMDLSGSSTANLMVNGSFESWPLGSDDDALPWEDAPDDSVRRESSIVRMGSYSAKLTSAGGLMSLRSGTRIDHGHIAGRTFTFGVWIYTTVVSAARIRISNDGVDSYSPYHSGTPQWEFLSVTRTMTAEPTGAVMFLFNEGPAGTDVYFDGAVAVEGTRIFSFSQHPSDEHVYAVEFQDAAGQNLKFGTPRIQRGETTITVDTQNRNEKVVFFPSPFSSPLGLAITVVATVVHTDKPGDDTTCYVAAADGKPLGDRFVLAVRRPLGGVGGTGAPCEDDGPANITIQWIALGT